MEHTPRLAPGATSDYGNDVNDHGLVGGERSIGGVNRAALFWENNVVDLPTVHGQASEVLAVNNHGVAVGAEWDTDSPEASWAFVWSGGTHALLDDLLIDAGLRCAVVRASDINDSNVVAARVRCDDGYCGARISPLP